MRIIFSLKALGGSLPVNYFHLLGASIYHNLHLGSPAFSRFLHDTGYKFEGKTYKMFTFALLLKKVRVEMNKLVLLSPDAELVISCCGIDEFIKTYLLGIMQKGRLEITSPFGTNNFTIENIHEAQEPLFSSEMRFTPLSPLVFSTGRQFNGKLSQYYLRAEDLDDINRVLNRNLQNKFGVLSKDFNNEKHPLVLEWDKEYIKMQLSRGRKLTKKVTLMGANNQPIDVIGLNIPFIVKGDPESIKILYHAGFGEKNSSGFGCVKTN